MAAQGFNQELRQKQTQSQILAPQLRHSLKILQVAAQDLHTTIQEELQTNPSLEELPLEGISLDDKSNKDDSNADNSSESNSNENEEIKFDETFEILNKLDQDWKDHFSEAGGAQNFTSEDAEKRDHFFNSLVTEVSLQEHLLSQAALADIDPKQLEAIEYLVGSLDNSGFLSTPLSDLALVSGHALSEMQEAHAILKSFDPPGIGAFDLQDCLATQLELLGMRNSDAYEIVQKHFALLARRRIQTSLARWGCTSTMPRRPSKRFPSSIPRPAADSPRTTIARSCLTWWSNETTKSGKLR